MMIPLVPGLVLARGGLPAADAPGEERCVGLSAPAMARQVSAVPALGNEVVLAPERPTEDDVKLLATALHADLTRVGERWRLFRSPATAKALMEADAAWLRGRLDAAVARMDALSRKYEKDPPGGPLAALRAERARFEARTRDMADDAGMRANEITPGARLLVDLLRQRPASILARATPDTANAPGGAVVLSNAPVGLESPLDGTEAALRSYAAAQEAFADWTEQNSDDVPDAYRWAFPRGAFRSGARTILLRVVRNAPEPVFALGVYGPDGRSESGVSFAAENPDDGPAVRPTAPLGQVALPPETARAMAQATPGTPEFRPEALDPIAHEPLDLVARDALRLWARAKGYDRVVACLPDALLDGVRACVAVDRLDLDALTRAIERADCESLAVGRTLVVRPAHPLQEEATRVDRHPLGALWRAAARGTPDLDAICAYHAAYADLYDRRPAIRSLERPLRDAFDLLNRCPEWGLPHPLLATLGSLPEEARRLVVAGGRLPLDVSAYPACLFDFAEFASQVGTVAPPVLGPNEVVLWSSPGARISPLSDLERTPLRIMARVRNWWIESAQESPRPVVQSVSKTDGKVVSPSFEPLEMFNGPVRGLYNYYWAVERPTDVRIVLDDVATAGPFRLLERTLGPKEPVPFEQVPGVVK